MVLASQGVTGQQFSRVSHQYCATGAMFLMSVMLVSASVLFTRSVAYSQFILFVEQLSPFRCG
jgi:hypothetical protein